MRPRAYPDVGPCRGYGETGNAVQHLGVGHAVP
jgi:hypothetical protein